MWLPWERARLRSWADEIEAAGDVLGDRIKRSLAPPRGASLGSLAKRSLEANQASQGGVGADGVALLDGLEDFEAGWQHGVLVSLRPRLYAEERVPEEGTLERLLLLLHEPVARFLQELALPGEWGVGESTIPSLISALVGAGVELRVLRLGAAHELRAHDEQGARGRPQGMEALRLLLGPSDGADLLGGALDPRAHALLRPGRGLHTLCWHHLAMPLWCVGPADNPTRLARLKAWLERPEPTATALALVGRGLWDRSSSVRRRALVGLGELGLAGASLIPELLRVRRRPTGWSRELYTMIDGLTESPAFVDAFASRLRADEEAHLRWLRHTRCVGARAAIPALTRALAIVPVPVPSGLGKVPPEWQRCEWRELVLRLRTL